MNADNSAPLADAGSREVLLHGPEGIFLAFPELARIREAALALDRRIRAEDKAAVARQSLEEADA